MSPTGFKPAIPASELPQVLALGRSATGIGLTPYADYIHIQKRRTYTKGYKLQRNLHFELKLQYLNQSVIDAAYSF